MEWSLAMSLVASTIVPTADLSVSRVDPCARFDAAKEQSSVRRKVTAIDLVELADIGRSDPQESESPFGISPDGRYIAFLVRRGNAQENGYCQQLLVLPVKGGENTREVDRGGEFIRSDTDLRGFVSIMRGTGKVITPRWSPDGNMIAYLKQEGKTRQVWLVGRNGSQPAYRATDMPDHVDDFSWNTDGSTLVVATRPGIRAQAEAIAKEARTGFLFDGRFSPQLADRPIPVEPVAIQYDAVDVATGAIRRPTPSEISLLRPDVSNGTPDHARGFAIGAAGYAAWREPLQPRKLLSPTGLVMRRPDGRTQRCEDRCNGIRQSWWSQDGRTLYALRKSGWGQSQTELLRWKVGFPAPKSFMLTNDALIGCELARTELICLREGQVQPRRLVAINVDDGQQRLIHDPNPAFRTMALGRAQRLTFRNAYGVESFADLILPPSWQPGKVYPLIVVQYHSDGFLRGGTGDEFPIQLFAAKGFAVLSFARPDFVPKAMAAESELELRTSNRSDWTDRRNVQSSLEIAIERAFATGMIDRDRIGITGFSDGTSTTQWALVNASLFKAAALGSCCEDMIAFPLAAGPTFTQFGRDMGYRFFEPGVADYWKPMSLTLNVGRIDIPILIQTGDSEYEAGLDVVETFKHHGKAIELYVLEGEPHVKYQPAHRLAMYRRSTEWFQFWLKGIMNCDPASVGQYDRWKAMRGAPGIGQLRCEADASAGP